MTSRKTPALNALNFQHLLYFWTVGRLGSVVRAAAELHLAQPTVSGQIKLLEQAFGEPLLERRGRRLVLTEFGHIVFQYADDIFSIGRELQETIAGHATSARVGRLAIGISDSLPKLTTVRLLDPVVNPAGQYRVILRVGKTEQLLSELVTHELDMVLTDVQPALAGVRAYSHSLGESDVTVFGTGTLARRCRPHFPQSLHGAPFLMHGHNTALRRVLDHWLTERTLQPAIVAEVEDVALLQALGQRGLGLFAAPSVVAREICQTYGVKQVGRLTNVREQFFAVSMERKVKHPGVLAIRAAAERNLFRKRSEH